MKQFIVIMSGLPFSGKSTIAKQLSEKLGTEMLSYDDDIYAQYKSEVPAGTSKAKEFDMIEALARKRIAARLELGESLIYDDLCLEYEERRKLVELAKAHGSTPILIYLDTPVSVIEQRRDANLKTNNRQHLDDAKLQLDISLLQLPMSEENAIVVKPETAITEIVNVVRAQL